MKVGESGGELESRIQFSECRTNPVEAMPRLFAPPDARLSADQEILVALFQNSCSQPRWFFFDVLSSLQCGADKSIIKEVGLIANRKYFGDFRKFESLISRIG